MMYYNSVELLLNPQEKIKPQKSSEDEKKPTQHKQTRMIPSLSRVHCSFPHIDLIDQDWVELQKKKHIRLSSSQLKSKAVYE